jgi:hypothetical protein
MKFIKTFDDLEDAMVFVLRHRLGKEFDDGVEFPEEEEAYRTHVAAGKPDDEFDYEGVHYQVYSQKFDQIKDMSPEQLQSKFTYYEKGDGQCRGRLTMDTPYYHCLEGWTKEIEWYEKSEDADDYLICVNNDGDE